MEPQEYELRVYGQQPGWYEVEFLAAFRISRWQWAEKLAATLREDGFTKLKIKKCKKGRKVKRGAAK